MAAEACEWLREHPMAANAKRMHSDINRETVRDTGAQLRGRYDLLGAGTTGIVLLTWARAVFARRFDTPHAGLFHAIEALRAAFVNFEETKFSAF